MQAQRAPTVKGHSLHHKEWYVGVRNLRRASSKNWSVVFKHFQISGVSCSSNFSIAANGATTLVQDATRSA
eukprot:14724114-Alexandrium_andersonii.AAC.1